MLTFLTCNTGALTSPAFTLAEPFRPHALMVPSLSVATRVTVEFTATSGAGLFHPLQRPDGTGLVFTVTSGPGVAVCVLPKLPTSYGRVAFANSQTQVATLTLLPLRG